MCLLLCVIGGGLEGCAVLAPRYHQRKEAERQHQEKIKYLESLNSCGSAEWFNKCKSNELPPYRSIAVHVKPWMVIHVNEGPKPLYLQDAERIAERILKNKGYDVVWGRNLKEDECVEKVEKCSAGSKYNILPGVKNKQLVEVKHNLPLFLAMAGENNNWPGCDAVLFLEYRTDQAGTLKSFNIWFQLYDVKQQRLVMWTDAGGIPDFFGTAYGQSFQERAGNKIYTKTPYWFTGNEIDILEKALTKAFNFLPSWSDGKLIVPEFTGYDRSNCGMSEVLLWRN